MFQLFFPVAIAAVIMIVLVVVYLVSQEKASCRRQKMWAQGYFAAQDPRYDRPRPGVGTVAGYEERERVSS